MEGAGRRSDEGGGLRRGVRGGLACLLVQGEQLDQELKGVSRQWTGQFCWLQPRLSERRHSWEQLFLQ